MTATVLTLTEPSLQNIPAHLRRLADDIEAGAYGEVSAAVTVLEAPQVAIFGAGDAEPVRAMGLLHLGLGEMARMALDWKVGR